MGPVPTPVDQVNDLLQNLKVDAQGKPTEFPEPAPSQDGNISDSSGDVSVSSGDFMSVNNGHEVTPESGLFYSTNGYATHPGYAYDYTQGVEWEEYPRYVGLNGVDPTIYGENGSVVYHPGYGYPYSPGPFHAIVADGQLYGPSFQFSGPVYHQYPVMEGDHLNGDGSTGGNSKGAQRPGYPVTMVAPNGPYPRGVMAVHNSRQDTRGGYEGLRATAPAWVDMKSTEQRRPSNSTQSNRSLAHQQPSQSQKSTAPPALPGALGTAFPPLTRAVLNASATGKGGRALNGNGVDNRGNGTPWVGIDRTKPKGKGAGVLSNGNGSLDVLTEQNRGPRTSKVRSQRVTFGFFRQPKGQGEEAAADNVDLTSDQYNRPDFATSYEDAKFFIIKSYSEDDVHKSIKYSVWASTPNGNKRLDAAYQEAQVKADSKKGGSPVFLFFSVNASGQFCGVAEMTGPVDFIKSMDFWQQDKWSGRFSVKWHIIKDIPNSQFRHIILENNDNKPVTNSRDTQEVKFGQGIEMLKIFKHYPSNTSILDDFQYYESRQKAMQEKRSRQQQRQQGSVLHNADPVSKTKNEDNVVVVENGKVNQSTEDVVSSNSKDDAVEASALPKKSYLRSLAGEKDAGNIEVDVKAA